MPNRLSKELSPYLLQHQNNPVNWFPWGQEAFQKAKDEDKPVFLSIGYATCHWCHVMEHESFEDKEVAALLNEVFVPVKVDREERPDIDQVYMAYCQLSTGHGGWPLTIIMTPEGNPFFAATYIPKNSRHGRVGMLDLIPRVENIWTTRRSEVLNSAANNAEIISKASDWAIDAAIPSQKIRTLGYEQLKDNYDPEYGGFGNAPKFPSPHQLLFLLDYAKSSDDADAYEMVAVTLQKMRLGGIFDQIGFGFHRYSTDAIWLLPHFEKMLYDQAMIALASIEAYAALKEEVFKEIAERIFEYVLRDMTSPEGGFYSAEDADSEGVEGKFYVWTNEEVEQVIGEKAGALFCETYQFESRGNFVEEATRERTGANIPHLKEAITTLNADQQAILENSRALLFKQRKTRIHPLKDDKILTDWNGLMIAAFARYAWITGDDDAIQYAARAASFIKQTLYTEDGRLLHRFRNGHAGLQSNIDDYAFLVWGLLELYQATFDVDWLTWAIELNQSMIEKFWDETDGGFFFSPSDGEALIIRTKEAYDGAIPSGNSVALLNLLKLARLTGNTDYEEKADWLLRMFGAPVRRQPSGFTALLIGLGFVLGKSYEIVVIGEKQAPDTKEMLRIIREANLPYSVILQTSPESTGLHEIAPFTKYMKALNDKATVYVCQNFECHQPVNSPEELQEILRS